MSHDSWPLDERVMPDGDLWADHVARYSFAAERVSSSDIALDAGAGTGYGAGMIGASRVVAVDRSSTAVGVAASQPAESVHHIVADLLALPFPSGTFDVVTCMEVVEHVPHPPVLVRELARVLRPGGLAFVSTPNARIELAFERSQGRQRWEYHISPLTAGQLRRVLRAEFSQVEVLGQSLPAGRLHLAVKALDILGLRFRRQAQMAVPDQIRPRPGIPGFVFSPILRYGANQLMAVAHK